MGLCENSEREKKGRVWGFSVFLRREKNGGVEEFGGYGTGGTSNGFVTSVFYLELISFGAKGFYCG